MTWISELSSIKIHISIGLGFLNPMSQLRQVNVIGFCMQLGNSEDRYDISEREGITLEKGRAKRDGKYVLLYVHLKNDAFS